MNLKDLKIDKSWTLFLDRDGVINQKIENSYVLKWEDFRFIEGVKQAFMRFAGIFGRIIVVTNQQCIGKGIINALEIEVIHDKMRNEIAISGGRIDKVYYSPEVEGAQKKNSSRKPATGMAYMAKNDFPEVDFGKSVMAGDSVSDMMFGKNLGMVNVLITGNKKVDDELNELIYRSYHSLEEFADDL